VQLGVKNGYVPDLTELKANWVARAGVAVPLFNGHRTRSRVAEAEANLEAARARTRALERRTEAEVRRAVTDLEASRDRMQTAQVQVAQAEQAVATAKSRYEAGVATNLDVLDAETSLSNARLARLGARYEYVTSRYALEKATGGEPW
jgi:outer membrane protein